MSAKGSKEKKIKVYGSKLLKDTRFDSLPFNLLKDQFRRLKSGNTVELPQGFVNNYPQYFIKD